MFSFQLKKNIMNVDQHVSQYVQIVDDLRKEICSLKEKVSASLLYLFSMFFFVYRLYKIVKLGHLQEISGQIQAVSEEQIKIPNVLVSWIILMN